LSVAGGGIVAVLAWLLWQAGWREDGLRRAEAERATSVAERILQRAPASRAAFAALPPAVRAVARGDGTLIADDVGWLAAVPTAADVDAVVDDRLERATRSEFTAGDAAATRAAYDELLAAPLVPATRLQVVIAAAWHARRADDEPRGRELRRELDARLAALSPADLARPGVARSVAGAMRLAMVAGEAAPAGALAPFLPPELFSALPDVGRWRNTHLAVVQRRELLVLLAAAWSDERAAAAAAGLRPLTRDRLLWWQARADGGHDLAAVTSCDFVAAIAAAGRDGALPELPLPWSFVLAGDVGQTFAGLPGVGGITTPPRSSVWLQPALIGGLLVVLALAFSGAIRLRLRAARAEVAAVRTQSEFLTTVTHELKTPLAAIRLLGEMLADGRARGREADYYRMLAAEAARLSMLIENVLDLGRLEREERAYDLREVAVDEVVDETLSLFAPVAERDGAGVVRGPAGEAVVRVDRAALVQALVAVLDNARKYGSKAPVEVSTRCDGGRAAIDVRDHGPGVPVAERDRIFERFVRGSLHAHGSTPGVGIGLYLARSIARRLGGDLVVGDPLDGGPGARFTFWLPMESNG